MEHRCCSKEIVRRGLWSPEEDEKLANYIEAHGHGSWSSVPKLAGLQRCGKSCRLRWMNYLRPDLKRGSFTEEEERIIIEVHRILGNRWSQIAKYLPGRTDNEVKNFWNSTIKKKLLAQGLDPNTHRLIYPDKEHIVVHDAFQSHVSVFSTMLTTNESSSYINSSVSPNEIANQSLVEQGSSDNVYGMSVDTPSSDYQFMNTVFLESVCGEQMDRDLQIYASLINCSTSDYQDGFSTSPEHGDLHYVDEITWDS